MTFWEIKMINKLFFLVEKKFRLRLFILFLGMLFSSFLEILSIGSIPFFVNALFNSNNIYPGLNFEFLQDILKNYNDETIIFFMSGVLVFIFGLKSIFLSFLIYLEAKFMYNIKVSNSVKLFNSFLNLPYIEHATTNSSKIIRNIINENSQASTILQLSLISLREGLVMLIIFIFLMTISFLGILSIFTLASVSIFFYLIFKSKLKKKGIMVQEKRADILQKINEASGSIKDIKVMGIENFVNSEFKSDVTEIESNTLYDQVLSKLPRIIIEFFAIFIIFIVSAISFKLNFEIEFLISTLTLIGVSTIRLMPAFNAVTSCSTKIRYLYPSLEIIVEKFKTLDVSINNTTKDTSKNIIPNDFENLKLNDVNFFYEKRKKILDKFSLEIKKGDKIIISGKSGSGKSTLLDLILGLLDPNSGEVTINNKKYDSNNNYFSYVPQNIYLVDNTIKKNITLGVDEKNIDKSFLKKIISICELDEFIEKLPSGIDTIVGEKGSLVSGGQKQRIAIARALYSNREILIIDEGTNALDDETEKKIIFNILNLLTDKTLIFTTHKNNIKKYFDKAIEIESN